MSALGPVDVAVLVGYFAMIGVVSVWVSRHQAESKSESSTDTYFLAERSVKWWAAAASLFASNIGSEHFIGLAGSAAKSGTAVGWYEVGAIPVVLLAGFFFLPIYLNAGIQTTPDYLEKRYSKYCRTLIVGVSLLVYIFSRVSATLFAGQIILVQLIHVNKWIAVIILVAFTTVYTVLGGLEAVIYTEALQTLVLLLGGFMVIFYSLGEVDGWTGLVNGISNLTSPNVTEEFRIGDDFLHFFRPSDDSVYPWTGFIFGFYVIAPWYWCVDQVIVQRILAAKNVAHGQLGCVAASCLKFLPFFMMVVPGLCARVIVSNRLGPEELREFDYDHSYPWLVLNVIPKNARGIIVASMLSSLMSALASTFNSCATLFSLNIWKDLYPNTSEQKLVHVGRLTVVVMALLSLLWLPVMHLLGNSLFLIIQKPPSYLSPPILCLYLWGMLSSRPNRKAGNWTLTLGLLTGLLRFCLELVEDAILVGEDDTADGVNDSVQSKKGQIFGLFTSMNFLHFAAVSFWVWTVVLFILSHYFARISTYIATGEIPEQPLNRLLFKRSLFDELMSVYYKSHQDTVTADDLDSPLQNGRRGLEIELRNQRSSDNLMSGTTSANEPPISLDANDNPHHAGAREFASTQNDVDLTEISLQDLPLGDLAENESPGSDNGIRSKSMLDLDGPMVAPSLIFNKQVLRGLAFVVLFFWMIQVLVFR